MPTNYPAKIGFYSLRKTAHTLCRFLFQFTPVIKYYFPDNTALHDALDLANSACGALVEEIDAQRAAIYPP